MPSFNVVLLGPFGVFIVDLIPVEHFQHKVRKKPSSVVLTLTQMTTCLSIDFREQNLVCHHRTDRRKSFVFARHYRNR